IFEDYVKFFYDKRLEFSTNGNKVYGYLCKLLLNSLYGKFGQKSEVWEKVGMDFAREYDYWTEFDYDTKVTHTYRAVNYVIEERKGYDEGYNSLVSIPAEITANARLYLWQLIKKAGVHNVFYCDTDSILVNDEGLTSLTSLTSRTELGLLKVQRHPSKVIIRGLKDYVMDKTDKIKGISKNAEKAGDNSFYVYRNVGIRSGLHNKDINKVVWVRTLKNLKRIYNKGVIMSNSRVMPLNLMHYDNENWIDFEKMSEAYGEYALFKDKYLAEHMGFTISRAEENPRAMLDYSMADRLIAAEEKRNARRRGEMIYQ
ncbi:unnamed protein product, partial [marine sediment metagenome]